MKYISSKQWSKLITNFTSDKYGDDVATKSNKGDLFEYLTEELLAKMFLDVDLKFTATQKSHDGSKDFWGIDDNKDLWWAECKNYKSNVSMTILSPTLLMAELYEVEYLMFFSYTKLNDNLKRKIGLYGKKHNKKIYVYDDEILEKLVIEHIDLTRYLPDFHEENYSIEIKESIETFQFNELNPMFLKRDNFSGNYKIDEIRYGNVYNINLVIINRSLVNDFDVKIVVDQWEDRKYFELLSTSHFSIEDDITFDIHVQSCQAILIQLPIRFVKYINRVALPTFSTECEMTNISSRHLNNTNRKHTCSLENVDAFIGDHYDAIVNTVADKCMNRNRFSGFMIYGTSGTGKTKILKECSVNFLKSNYDVLNFYEFDFNNDWTNFIRELLYYVFSIEDDLKLDILCDSLENPETKLLENKESKSILAFLKLLNQEKISVESLKLYFKLIFEKMRKSKYLIIVDNVQSYSPDLTVFFNEMISFFLNSQEKQQTCIMFSLNIDLIFNEAYSSLLSTFINLSGNSTFNSFVCKEIQGFKNEYQAITFLQLILKLKTIPLNNKHLIKILSKTSLRPKYIEQLAKYIETNNGITSDGEYHYVTDENHFRQLIEEAPTEYKEIFRKNFNLICREYKIEGEAEIIVGLLFLFGTLTRELIEQFNINKHTLKYLKDHNIIENIGTLANEVYKIEHDLSAKCLTNDIFPNSFDTAVNQVVNLQSNQLIKNMHLFEYNISLMATKKISYENLMMQIAKTKLSNISNRLQYDYNTHLIKNMIYFIDRVSESEFIKYTLASCIHVRDHISEVKASSLFDLANTCIKNFELTTQPALKRHFAFIIHMAENKVRINSHEMAMILYRDYLSRVREFNSLGLNIEKELEYAKAYIHNRIFVCGKHEGDAFKYYNNLKISKEICHKYGYYDTMFENYFDEANLYLTSNESIVQALECLEKGFKYFNMMSQENQRKYRVNFYSKKLQYFCLTGKYEDVIKLSNDALQSIEYNDEVNYHLFFKSKYLRYKILGFLLLERITSELDATIEDYCFVMELLGTEYSLDISYNKAKYAILNKDSKTFLVYFKSIYERISSEALKQKKYSAMLENLAVDFRRLNIKEGIALNYHNENCKIANEILNFTKEEFDRWIVTYECNAPIYNLSKTHGYFL